MPTPTRPKKKKYTNEDVEKAIDAVRRNGMSVNAAAKSFGIPQSTLQDKISGKYAVQAKVGRPSVLMPEEENILVHWVINLAKLGFPVSKDQLISSVSKLVKELNRETPFVGSTPGNKWFNLFLNRHPEISQRVSQALTTARGNITEEQIRRWFLEVKSYMEEKNLLDVFENPKRIFNTDETAFYLCPTGKTVLARKGEKTIHSISGNDEKECLTVLVTANAAGDLAPPMVVYPYERVPAGIVMNSPDSWGIGKSESGWMTCETFFEYITNVFHPWLLNNDIGFPVILFLDGHTSHLTYHLTEFCQQNKIELVALYPNATHIMQPMDVAVFHPMKSAWKKHVQKWRLDNNGRKMKREEFAPLLNTVFKDLKKETIANGFVATGLKDLNPENIKYEKLIQKNSTTFGQSITLKENKLKEIKSHLNYIETKIGVEKVRNFASGQIATTDESLFLLWQAVNKDVNDITNQIERSRQEKNKEPNSETTKEPAKEDRISIEDPRTDDFDEYVNLDNDVSQNLVVEEGLQAMDKLLDEDEKDNGLDVIKEIEDLLEINNDNRRMEDEDLACVNGEEAIDDVTGLDNGNANLVAIEVVCEDAVIECNDVVQEKPHDISIQAFQSLPGCSGINSTPEKNPDKNAVQPLIPSPFKRNLFWPEPSPSNKKRRSKEKIPAVVTSDQYKAYLKKKDDEKKKKEEEKEIRRLQREAKKIVKQEVVDTNKKVAKRKKKDISSDSDNEDDDEDDCLSPIPPSQEDLDNLAINSWVVVPYIIDEKKEYFVGQVKSIQGEMLSIKFLTKRGNKFSWPETPDIDNDVPLTEIVQILSPPNKERRGFFTFVEKLIS